ncbi:hypothetical protein BDB01DRAFT_808176 [Pilobolus umbonatus]|nr:hypothetical protein BDB01DRAFT_808176 [Pilobolus umbonatus]
MNTDPVSLRCKAFQNIVSPWESSYTHFQRNEDSSTCSTLDSTLDSACSSRSLSPASNNTGLKKKNTFKLMKRELRRLKNENECLRSTVVVLKNDIRNVTQSRLVTDASHKKIYENILDRNGRLEMEVQDRNDEIDSLKKQIEELKKSQSAQDSSLTLHDAAYFKNKDIFNCYEYEDYEPAKTDTTTDSNLDDKQEDADLGHFYPRTKEEEDMEDEDDEPEEVPEEVFEEAAISYIHQATLSKLSSARVRIELDDIILKYDPDDEVIQYVLARSFIRWIVSSLRLNDTTSPVAELKIKIQEGITSFWKSILQSYTNDESSQIQLLNFIELTLTEEDSVHRSLIVDHFDRLLIMLFKYHIIYDEAIIAWWHKSMDHVISRKLRTVTTKFVEWVEASEEESDQDTDDETEEESEEAVEEESDSEDICDFVDSPMDDDDDSIENEVIDALLLEDKACCICQFDNDTNNNDSNTSISQLPHNQASCSCDYTDHLPVSTKKTKSVRISL